jgi:hypothetical protein
MLANAYYSTKQLEEGIVRVAQSNYIQNKTESAIHTDRGSRCGG